MTTRMLGPLETSVLLAVLEEGEEAFALEVRRAVEKADGRPVARASIYITLERLGEKGLVSWENMVPPNARRALAQRRYTVTPAGMAALRRTEAEVAAEWKRLTTALEGP